MADKLWTEVEETLLYHAVGGPPMKCLNRLFRKAKTSQGESDADLPSLNKGNCSITREQWTTEQLEAIPRDRHTRTKPGMVDPPIIVVMYRERPFLIDGQTRINLWNQNKDDGLHDVLVIEPHK